MRGKRSDQDQLFSYVRLEDRIPFDHPLRSIRSFVEPILVRMSPRFDEMYSAEGRPSIPPEQLIRALLIQALYTVRSERMLCEQLQYNLLFRWFVDLSLDGRVWVAEVLAEAERQNWISDDHFTVDGTLLEAWASQKSFRPKGESTTEDASAAGRNPDQDFRGEARSNETHESRTDPDARLARKGSGKESKLAYLGNALMENRNGLIIDTEVMRASGTAEREAAVAMVDRLAPTSRKRTVGADKGYDTQDFVQEMRKRNVTPHVAQNNKNRRSAIDGRTTSHPGYAISQEKRKRIEQTFGWQKTVGHMRKLKHRGVELVGWLFRFSSAAYNLVRMRTLAGAVCA
jgi:transposase